MRAVLPADLDLRLVQQRPSDDVADVVQAHADRTAAVVAEGIETPEHLESALAYGAIHG